MRKENSPGVLGLGKGVARTHYLHVVEYGGAKWTNHLCFRDRLRNDPELAQAYVKLKEELSRKFRDSRTKYHNAKSKFISGVVGAYGSPCSRRASARALFVGVIGVLRGVTSGVAWGN